MRITPTFQLKTNIFLSLGLTMCAGASYAQNMVVTPKGLAPYTYFRDTPPRASNGLEDGFEGLERCLLRSKTPNGTATLDGDFGTVSSVRLYYLAAGGDGGTGSNGGGGGSSAVFHNGSLVRIANGGDGSAEATAVRGEFFVKKGDTLGWVIGGGGGSGVPGAAGGGGGAGWTGGGAGSASAPGKGGGTAPGQGGAGGHYGTAGSGNNGGVSTYPDGNTAATTNNDFGPTVDYYRWQYLANGTTLWVNMRRAATPTVPGSPPPFLTQATWYGFAGTTSGHGGAWGQSGAPTGYFGSAMANGGFMFAGDEIIYSNTDWSVFNVRRAMLKGVGQFVDNDKMELSRDRETITRFNEQWPDNGNHPGQVVFLYHALKCNILTSN